MISPDACGLCSNFGVRICEQLSNALVTSCLEGKMLPADLPSLPSARGKYSVNHRMLSRL
jgi:hypothetical protein